MSQKTNVVTIQENPELTPLRAVLHGPPACGKTMVAKRLCKKYGAHYVSVKTMIEETLEELQKGIETIKTRMTNEDKDKITPEGLEDEEEEEEDVENEEVDDQAVEIELLEEQIRDINRLMAQSENGKLPDEYVVRMMRSFLVKDVCVNNGYVLDGYPKTIQQARELFGQAAESGEGEGEIEEAQEIVGEEEEEGGEGAVNHDQLVNASNKLIPQHVVSFQATDDFLCERVMRLPQREIQGTHYDESNMLRRLGEFRAANTEENTVLMFFDEIGVHPLLVEIEDKEFECILSYLYGVFGEAIPGLGLTPEEEEEVKRLEMEAMRLRQEAINLERQLIFERATKEYEDKMEKWAQTLENIRMEEEKIMAAQCQPLRFYLTEHVFPILTKGLVEVATVKPKDPVDFLAEFLFRENPEGKMFDPSYSRDGERRMDEFRDEIEEKLLEIE